jgi:hypothetical protein
VGVAAAMVLPAFVAPGDAVATAFVAAPTDAAAVVLAVLPLPPHPAIAVARASRTVQAMILFMCNPFTS